MTEKFPEQNPIDLRTDSNQALTVELSTSIAISDEQLEKGDIACKPGYYQTLLSRLKDWAVADKILLHYNNTWFVQIIGAKTYYLLAADGSIATAAGYKFSADAVEASEPVVRASDGNLYLESQAPSAPAPTYQELRAAAYPDIREYLDAQVKINSGNETLVAEGQSQLEDYYQACLAVKAQYPKPENNNAS